MYSGVLFLMAAGSVYFGLQLLRILPALLRLLAALVSGAVKWPGPRVHDAGQSATRVRQRLGVGYESLFSNFTWHALIVFAGFGFSLLSTTGITHFWIAPRGGSNFEILLVSLIVAASGIMSTRRVVQHARQVDLLLAERTGGVEPRAVESKTAEGEYAIEHPLLGRPFGSANSPRALNIFNEGTASYQAGNTMAAHACYEEAMQLDPSLHQHACGALAKLAANSAPKEAGAAYYWLGAHSEYLSDLRQARAAYEKAIQAYAQLGYPHRESRAHCNLGNVKMHLLDASAMDEFERAVALNPRNGTAHLNIGMAYYRISEQGDSRFEQALDAFASAILADPGLYGSMVMGRMREIGYEWQKDLDEVLRRVAARQGQAAGPTAEDGRTAGLSGPQSRLKGSSKSPGLIFAAFAAWAGLVLTLTWVWVGDLTQYLNPSLIAAAVNAIIWLLALLWGLHHLSFRLWSMGARRALHPPTNVSLPAVAILYPTCDDFNPASCQSCLGQNYPHFRLLICDDSVTEGYQTRVREFCARNPGCSLVSRPVKSGYKAGNLNFALENYVKEEWFLLVDADQRLPADFLSELVSRLPLKDEQVAFVQGAHKPDSGHPLSFFQEVLSPEISLFYHRDLPGRETHGFVPLLGHGALVRRSAWEKLGKFPELVSEDFAFSLRAARSLQVGIYVEDVPSFEAYPFDFGGFMIRLKKYAGGTAELLRKEFLSFLTGPAPAVEKWDFGMQLYGYVLAPLVVLNGFLGAYTLHYLMDGWGIMFNTALPFLYTFFMVALLWINGSVTRDRQKAWQMYLWGTAVYAASLPLTGFAFLKHLLVRPAFKRTPKNSDRTPIQAADAIFMLLLGLAALACAIIWPSPYSWVLAGLGCAYLGFPLYGHLNDQTSLGKLARLAINLPGWLMLVGLITSWTLIKYGY